MPDETHCCTSKLISDSCTSRLQVNARRTLLDPKARSLVERHVLGYAPPCVSRILDRPFNPRCCNLNRSTAIGTGMLGFVRLNPPYVGSSSHC